MSEKYKYNNKDLAKLNIIDTIRDIKRKHKDIYRISIKHINTTRVHNYIHLSLHNKSIISIMVKNAYSLSLCQDDEYFHYKNLNNNLDYDRNKILPFPFSHNVISLDNQNIIYQDKHRINCKKISNIFNNLLEKISNHCYNDNCLTEQLFNFHLNSPEILQKDIELFLGKELCCHLFYNELDTISPDNQNLKLDIIKF